jgi:fluoroquinolone transport system permease protein
VRRVAAALRADLRLQLRHGFLLAGAVVASFWVLVLSQLPAAVVTGGMAVFVFLNLLVTTFYFVAGWVLFEKGEGTLEALVVTPLRESEYLASKIAVLTALGAAETLVIVLLVHGADLHWLPAAAGTVLTCALYTLCGFVAVARYDSIDEFLLPSTLLVLVLQLPVLDVLGVFESPLFLAFPTYASLLLLEAAFHPVPAWKLVYALGWAGLATALLFRHARGTFRRFIVRRERGPRA